MLRSRCISQHCFIQSPSSNLERWTSIIKTPSPPRRNRDPPPTTESQFSKRSNQSFVCCSNPSSSYVSWIYPKPTRRKVPNNFYCSPKRSDQSSSSFPSAAKSNRNLIIAFLLLVKNPVYTRYKESRRCLPTRREEAVNTNVAAVG